MVNDVYLGLGSNVGDRIGFIRQAVNKIKSDNKNFVEVYSSIYESKPYGIHNQENFLNAVIKVKTEYSLKQFFNYIKQIETNLGRKPTGKWEPREIDIDILFFNDMIYSANFLTVPHPEIIYRDFVTIPLLEVDPDFVHPVFKEKIRDLIDQNRERFILGRYPENILKYSGETLG